MLKKLLYGVILTATVTVGSSVFTSCKDTDEDWKIEMESQQIDLLSELQKLKNSLENCSTTCRKDILAIQGRIAALESHFTNDSTTWTKAQIEDLIKKELTAWDQQNQVLSNITSLQNSVDTLKNRLDSLQTCGCDLSGYLPIDSLESQLRRVAPGLFPLLTEIAGKGAALKALAEKQTELSELAANSAAILELLGENGTISSILNQLREDSTAIAGLTGNVNSLDDIINGKDGKGGLVKKTDDLWKYFQNEDKTTKWTVGDFQDAIAAAEWVKGKMASLQAIVNMEETLKKLNGANIDALNNFLQNNTFDQLATMYNTLFPAGEDWGETTKISYLEVVKKLNALDGRVEDLEGNFTTLQDYYNDLLTQFRSLSTTVVDLRDKVTTMQSKVDGLIDRVDANKKDIDALKVKMDGVFNRLNELVTGLILQASTNSVIGNVNTPFGINSMVLMTYYGENKGNIHTFPACEGSIEFDAATAEGERAYVDWDKMPNAEFLDITSTTLVNTDDNGNATLGQLWFTVNPGTVSGLNVNNFALVNSADVASEVSLVNVTKDDETVLTYGTSRAGEGNGNGLYRADATVNPKDLDNITINIEPGLVQSLKDAVNNRTATDVARVVKNIYQQLQNICVANALRYNYEATTGYDDNNVAIREEQKVYSNYGVAATAFKPLGFATLYGTSLRPLPEWPDIKIDKNLVDLGLDQFEIGDSIKLNVQLDLGKIEIGSVGETLVWYKYPAKFDKDGNIIEWGEDYVNIQGELNSVIANIQGSIDEWFDGNPDKNQPGLEEKFQEAIKQAVDEAFNGPDGLIADIEGQVNDMMGKIQDKLYNLVDQINTDYIGKINRIGSYYTRLANRINNVLKEPNHYLQVMMMYRTADGNLARLSDNASRATVFRGSGEAIELWATNYNFEALCPIYRKFVGVTKVTYTKDGETFEDLTSTLGAQANNHGNLMATAFTGERGQLALDITGAKEKGTYTYELAYQGLDYRGRTSTNKYYIKVVR